MTRDELLNIYTVCGQPTKDGSVCDGAHLKESYPEWFALRAVVELAGKDIEHESYVWLDGYDYAMKQIIQAIEKELSNG